MAYEALWYGYLSLFDWYIPNGGKTCATADIIHISAHRYICYASSISTLGLMRLAFYEQVNVS